MQLQVVARISVFIISWLDTSTGNRNERTKPYSVTSFEGLEDLYSHSHNLNREGQLQGNTQLRSREICEKVFYVRQDGTTIREVLLDWEWEEPGVRSQLVDERDQISRQAEEDNAVPWDAHASRPRKIFLLRDYNLIEKVLSCLVLDEQSDTIKQYFISDNVYNVNEARRAAPVEGRFIFSNRDESGLKVYALAEDYSRFSVSNLYEVARFYLTKRRFHHPAQDATNDPVCRLDLAQRVRLCNSVFMFEQLRKRCKIWPGDGCAKKRFRLPLLSRPPTHMGHEWMMTCTVLRHDGTSEEYHVSRSYTNNRVFVYRYLDGKLSMHHYTSRTVMYSYFHFAAGLILINAFNFAITQLTAINNSPYVGQLYLQIGNDEPPPEAEMHADPATRQEICSQITNSLHFRRQKKEPLDMSSERVYKKLKYKPKYEALYEDIYERTAERRHFTRRPRHHRYVNPYKLRQVKVDGLVQDKYQLNIQRPEYVFLCLIKESVSKNKVAYQVSKEYNVFAGRSKEHYIAGRFIFRPPPANIQLVILAEEPASVQLEDPTFNIELHYLSKKRSGRKTEKYSDNDPICKLIPRILALNQNHRICESILGSAYFKDEYVHVSRPHRLDDCRKRQVHFQTPEGQKEAARLGEYHEWMVYCLAKTAVGGDEVNFFVSRAYDSGQMFVYRVGAPTYHAYLENLSTHVSIIDDGGTTDDGVTSGNATKNVDDAETDDYHSVTDGGSGQDTNGVSEEGDIDRLKEDLLNIRI